MNRLTIRLALFLGASGLAAASAQPPLEYAPEDPAKIQTAQTCGECHVSEHEVWKKTPHATGFKTLHRKESAEKIAGRLGYRLIKRDSECLLCHYTPQVQGEQLRAVSGVSCESCHGAGADWINVHNDYGGKGTTHETETPEHRAARIAESRAAGMRRPSDLYAVASSCFGCHTVPDERLVNVGRHSIGSTGFELVAWSQGEIRHNFLESFKTGDGTVNADRPPEHLRRMYVTGRALELEHALRGVARATGKGVYLKAMQRRVRTALGEVRTIAATASLEEMDRIVSIVRAADVDLGNRAGLLAAAERVGEATRGFLERHDGTRLASLDPLRLGTASAVGFEEEPEEEAPVEVAATPAARGTPAGTASAGTTSTGTPAGTASAGTTARSEGTPAIPAVGESRKHIRPRSKHATLSAVTCQKCHGDQNAWWFDDAHYASIEPFLDRARKNVQIARLYGIDPRRALRGDTLCMDCHGTIVTGREAREVEDGVSCQSCHGPAKDFLEPHQEGDKALGAKRPGYVKALGLGMRALKDLETRAHTCTGCHYVTDQRLLSAGHPSGAGFDYTEGMRKIAHWQGPTPSASAIEAAFSGVLAARGAVPEVRLARLATSGPGPAAGQAAGATSGSTAAAEPSSSRPRTPRARPFERRASATAAGAPADAGEDAEADAAAAALGLPPFPAIDASTPVEDVLLILKERLELLYRAVRGEP